MQKQQKISDKDKNRDDSGQSRRGAGEARRENVGSRAASGVETGKERAGGNRGNYDREREARRAAARRRREAEVRRKKRMLALGIAAAAVIVILVMVIRGTSLRTRNAADAQQGTGGSSGMNAGSLSAASENSAGSAAASGNKENTGNELADASESSDSSAASAAVSGTFTVSAVGDCTLGTDENFDPDTSFVAKYNEVDDPSYFFAGVKSVLAADDLTIANLEGTLTTATERADKTFAFKGDPSYTQILTDGSVEAVNLANNHSHDYGEQSYEDTITNVTNAGIVNFGYDRTQVVDVNGIKVGLTGTYCLNGREEALESMRTSIQQVKDEGAEVIISSFHWGIEKDYVPDEDQIAIAHAAVDAGANLVLGHHPHVLQGIENYNGMQIVYSLGNFCFGGNKDPSDKDTMIYQQTFTVVNGVLQPDVNTNIIPCSLSSTDDYNDYQPTILTGGRKAEVEQKIAERSAEIP